MVSSRNSGRAAGFTGIMVGSAVNGSAERMGIMSNRCRGALLLIMLWALCPTGWVHCADIVVNRLDDRDGICHFMNTGCSLREAIEMSNATPEYDTIFLPSGRIEMTQVGFLEDDNHLGDLDITASVTIVGRAPGVSIVDANSLDRVFHVLDATVLFKMMTITGGGHIDMGAGGGGIRVDDGVAILQHCDVIDNESHYYAGAGLAASDGTLWLQKSSVRGNVAINMGGGISIGGGTSSILQIEDCTISGNAAAGGCAISTNNTTSLIRNSTISSNTCYQTGAGAVYVGGDTTVEYSTIADNTNPTLESFGSGSQLTLERTIIDGQCRTSSGGAIVTEYGNMESPGNTCNLDVDGDLRYVADPQLSALGRWGGSTETHRPFQFSPAVDHVFSISLPPCSGSDQRGIPRPQDGSNGVGTPCDIGAVELVYSEIFIDGFECGFTGGW